jgi:nicotinamide-nucleotide amidase
MAATDRLNQAAEQLTKVLQQKNLRVVFAESCTAGLVAATLSRPPGISEYLCGSAVVYREATKTAWLEVSAADLANPEITAVSPEVAREMAIGVLRKTPEANLSASITGYLGPDSALDMDGVAFIGIAARGPDGAPHLQLIRRIDLTEESDRSGRQNLAAAQVLELTVAVIGAGFKAESAT